MATALVACGRRVDKAQQAFATAEGLRCVSPVLGADIHRAAARQLALFEDVVKLQLVVVVKKHVVPDQRKARCGRVDRPGDG